MQYVKKTFKELFNKKFPYEEYFETAYDVTMKSKQGTSQNCLFYGKLDEEK